jgi:hypothetical protein
VELKNAVDGVTALGLMSLVRQLPQKGGRRSQMRQLLLV